LITACDDDSIVCYNTETALEVQTLYSKKYGVDFIHFTHHNSAVLCAPKVTSRDYSIRYLSLHDNRYLRTFTGHKNSIHSISMSPRDDLFLSGGTDGTARMWDLRSPDCSGIMHTSLSSGGQYSNVTTSFDKEGLIFATAIGGNNIKLFDARNYDAGPFSTFCVKYRHDLAWRNIEFSSDGKLILLTTPHGIIIVDSFDGNLVQNISGFNNQKGYPLLSSFVPDGNHVLVGSEDGFVHVYNATNGTKIATWNARPPHPNPVKTVLFNPTSMLAVSAGKNLAFWIPEIP